MNAACGLVVPLWTGTSPAGFPVGAAGPCRGGAGSTPVARQAPGLPSNVVVPAGSTGGQGRNRGAARATVASALTRKRRGGGYRHGKRAVHPAGSGRGWPSAS